MSFLGAKNGAGTYQTIINLMPPHDEYVEPFLGTGAVMKRKAPAIKETGIDLDNACLDFYKESGARKIELINCNAIEWLKQYEPKGKALIYADPPYLLSTRTSRARYDYEISEEDHIELAKRLNKINASVIISGYPSELYDQLYQGWFSHSFQAMTRGGVRMEKVWCNFQPSSVHYHTYAGADFTDRQRIKRKAQRWAKKFKALPPMEKQAILAQMLDPE